MEEQFWPRYNKYVIKDAIYWPPYYCCLRWVIHRQTQIDSMSYVQYTVYMCIDKTVLTEVIQQKQSHWS